jgi:CMP-N-acetylneuraminic acid synthetase
MLWCVIPARNNSKGVPGKNWARFADGTTCVGRALAMAEKFAPADRRILVTDSGPIGQAGIYRGVQQPRLCAEGGGTMLALMLYAMIEVRAAAEDWVMLLQPTSPFRTEAKGRELMDEFQDRAGDYGSICTAMPYPNKWHPQYQLGMGLSLPATRQELDLVARPDGGYYLTTVEQLYRCDGWGAMGFICSTPVEQLTIDGPDDWAEAEKRIREGA